MQAAAAPRRATSPVTRGRVGLFTASMSRSKIWFTVFEAMLRVAAARAPVKIFMARPQVSPTSPPTGEPTATRAKQTKPKNGASRVKGRASLTYPEKLIAPPEWSGKGLFYLKIQAPRPWEFWAPERGVPALKPR